VLCALALGIAAALYTPSHLHWRQATPYGQSLSRVTDTDHGSGKGRLLQWQSSLPMFTTHPLLGIGPAQWAYHYPKLATEKDPTLDRDAWSPTARLASNDGLTWLYERGLLGFASATLVLCFTFVSLWKRAGTRVSALATLTALLVASTLDVVLRLAPAVAVLALLLPMRAESDKAGVRRISIQSGPEARRVLGRSLAVLVALLLMLTLPRSLERARLYHVRLGADVRQIVGLAAGAPWYTRFQQDLCQWYLGRGDCQRALPYLKTLGRRRPYTPRVNSAWRECRFALPSPPEP
jgi:O-antigen ligase